MSGGEGLLGLAPIENVVAVALAAHSGPWLRYPDGYAGEVAGRIGRLAADGPGEMLRGRAADATPLALTLRQEVRGDKVVVVTVNDKGEENTVLVPIPAQAGYSVQHNEAIYLQQLNNYRVPGFERGEYRVFEVAGDSMAPTINHRDVVVTSRVEELRLLEPGEVYVVVTSESAHQVAGARYRYEVMLYSDNPHRTPYGLETRDILELWRVRGYVSSYIPSAPDVTVERL